MKTTPTPVYLVWQRGDGDPRKPENWRPATPLEVLGTMQKAFAQNLGKYSKQFPDAPINGASAWWAYLHKPNWKGVDLVSVRVRRCDPPPSDYAESKGGRPL
jgi:hypothetical protein